MNMSIADLDPATRWIRKGVPMLLTTYQRRWMQKIENVLHSRYKSRTICWVAARHAAKSWTTATKLAALACKMRLLITLIPGGKQEQGNEFSRYFRIAVPRKKRDKRHWSATRMDLKNGSRLIVAAPTEGGVESARANVIVFEEAQLLKQEIHGMALPQAGGANTVLSYIGTSNYPSILNEIYESVPVVQRMMTKWEEVVQAGILQYDALMDIKAKLTDEQWQEFYECIWVVKAGFPFHVDFVVGLSTVHRYLLRRVMGVDNNLERHAWVKVNVYNIEGELYFIAVAKGVMKFLSECANHVDVDIIVVEDEGKTGSSPSLAKQFAKVPVIGHDWMGGNKDANIDRVIKLREMGCHLQTTDKYLEHCINEQERDLNGRLVKTDDDSDYIDAWLHAMWVASLHDRPDIAIPENWLTGGVKY